MSISLLPACADDGGGGGTDDGTGTGTGGGGSSSGPGVDDGDDDGDGSSTAAVDDTTDGGGSDDVGPGSSSGGGDTGGSTDDDGGSSTGEPGFPCENIPGGPFSPEPVFMPSVFSGSEDLSFDGDGNLAAKDAGDVLVVDSAGAEVDAFPDAGPAWGLRYRQNGNLVIAKFMIGTVVEITPDGTRTDFATGVGAVNGLYPDFEDRVWFTNGQAVGWFSPDGERNDVVTGVSAQSANGVVYDPERGLLFFTNYAAGRIARVPVDAAGEATGDVEEVTTVLGAAMDGLSLDVCGNLYAVDQGSSRLYRVFLDEDGVADGPAQDLLDAPVQNIANAQFGRGAGWDEQALYAAGTPGVVYRVEVGVPGAPVP